MRGRQLVSWTMRRVDDSVPLKRRVHSIGGMTIIRGLSEGER